MMNKENYYYWVREITETNDVKKVNELLKQGWSLLSIKEGSKVDFSEKGTTQTVFVIYILGRGEQRQAPQNVQDKSAGVWKKNPDGSEWAYATDVPKELVEKAKQKAVENGYQYEISKSGKAVRRKPVKQQ